MIGKALSHYTILERIGAGGMGVVYRARDARLGRDVALKVLPADTLGSESARRALENEARTASALNHPNICTIHDVGEAEGKVFVAMEYVAGQPLAQMIPTGGLPQEQVLRYGMQIADALAHAEQRGIVHRDLKSANVVITPEGRAKVLDFGLAQRTRTEDVEEATRSKVSLAQAGGIAGTLAYMAPESLRGGAADARSDIWALGVVLYEMAAGAMPFRGATGYALSSAILREPPQPLPLRVPPTLRAVIERCLTKDPAQRYQHAGEVRAALEATETGTRASAVIEASPAPPTKPIWRSAIFLIAMSLAILGLLLGLNVGGLRDRLFGRTAGPAKIESIAVLPLANMSGDPNQEYFADGMTEAIITELAQISAFKKVTSRTSVMLYKSKPKPMPEIAKELGVDAIIEGSVQRAGDKVGITVQLIDPSADRHLWAKSYERDLRDVLALQREVAWAIVNEIRVQLDPAAREQLGSAPGPAKQVSAAAYDSYLLARFYRDRGGPEGRRKAIEYFEKALQTDPNYASALAGLAESYAALGGAASLALGPQMAFPKAKENALRALQLEPDLAEAYTALGLVQFSYEWDFAGAEKTFRHALQLNQNSVDAYHWYSHLLIVQKRPDESLRMSLRALELDPLNVQMGTHLAWHYFMAGEFHAAVKAADRTLEIHPESPEAWQFKSWGLSALAKHAEAVDAARNAAKSSKQSPRYVINLAAICGRAGKTDEAKMLLRSFTSASHAQPVATPYFMARAFLSLDDRQQAMSFLERAYQEREDYVVYSRLDPFFEPLHSDPDFQALLRRMNLPQ